MKALNKRERHKHYKLALKHYLELDNKIGLCYSISNCGKQVIIYDDIPTLFPEFKKRQDYLRNNYKDWPSYDNQEYRIRCLKSWIKATAPSNK